jgi:hypothetical protein
MSPLTPVPQRMAVSMPVNTSFRPQGGGLLNVGAGGVGPNAAGGGIGWGGPLGKPWR